MLELEVEERNLRRFLKREALSEEMLQKLQAQLPVNARTG
jgi:hypothetical protein